MSKKRKKVLLYLTIAAVAFYLFTDGLLKNSVFCGWAGRGCGGIYISLEDDAFFYYFYMVFYFVFFLFNVYKSLQTDLDHPLFGGGVSSAMEPEIREKVWRKAAESYIVEAEAFYEFEDELAAKQAVQKGLSVYPKNARLIELDKLIHARRRYRQLK